MGQNLLKSFLQNGADVGSEQVQATAEKTGVDNTDLNRLFGEHLQKEETDTNHSYPFYAQFYDETGTFIGNYGAGKPETEQQMYIVSYKMLELKEGSTAEQIVEKIGIEDNPNRQMLLKGNSSKYVPIAELALSEGAFKLPPKSHRDAIKSAIDTTKSDDYEIGGCGYHKPDGQFIHLRAVDGEPPGAGKPTVEVFNAVDMDKKVEKDDILTYQSGVKVVTERKVEYTWHIHPLKTNSKNHQQAPSLTDRNFARSYDKIKQHFFISKSFNRVCYFSFGMALRANLDDDKYKDLQSGEAGGFNIMIDYDMFFNQL